jgi:hypothetical protein
MDAAAQERREQWRLVRGRLARHFLHDDVQEGEEGVEHADHQTRAPGKSMVTDEKSGGELKNRVFYLKEYFARQAAASAAIAAASRKGKKKAARQLAGASTEGASTGTMVRMSEDSDAATLQAGVVIVASTVFEQRRRYMEDLCRAAIDRSMLVYSINPPGSVTVTVPGVYQLTTHPSLSKRAILAALLRHGAQVLVFGALASRDDVTLMMEAVYTGYQTICEMHGEGPEDVLARLEAMGVDISMLPSSLRIIVPGAMA